MRRSISLTAVALACLALTPLQESVRTIARLDGEVAGGPALSPDGRYLAMGSWDSGLRVIDVANGQSWTVVDGYAASVDWSPNGELLAFSRWDEEAGSDFIWTLPIDPRTGRAAGEARRVSVSGGDVVAFSPDGESIAFADYSGPGQRVVLVPTRGGRERVLAQAEGGISTIAWSSDGEWIYYAHDAFGSPRGVVARVRAAGSPAEVVWETPAGRPRVIEPGPMIVETEGGRVFPFLNEAGKPGSSPGASQGDDWIRILDRTGQNVLASLRPPPGSTPPPDGGLWVSAATADRTRFYGTLGNTEFRLMAVSLADGSATVLDTSPSPQFVATSVVDDRLVFRTEVDGALGFVVMSPDGSARREYRPRARPSPRPPNHRGRLVVSPDGNHLAYVSLDTLDHLVVLDLRNAQERVLASGGRLGFSWTSNGEILYDRIVDRVQPSRRTIHMVNLEGVERLLHVISESVVLNDNQLFLDDSTAVSSWRDRVELIALPTGDPRVVFRGPNDGHASVSPDHRHLAVKTVGRIAPRYGQDAWIDEADAIAIIDLESGQRRDIQLELSAPRNGGQAVWHPDGQHLLINLARSSGEWDTYLVPINGDRPRVLARGVGPAFADPTLTDGGNTVLVTVPGPLTTEILELTAGASAGGSPGGN